MTSKKMNLKTEPGPTLGVRGSDCAPQPRLPRAAPCPHAPGAASGGREAAPAGHTAPGSDDPAASAPPGSGAA